MSAAKPPPGGSSESDPADDLSSETVLDASLDALAEASRAASASRPAPEPAPRRQTSSRPALDPTPRRQTSSRPAIDPAPRPSTSSRAALEPAPAAPRRATGTRQALTAPINDNQTVLFDSNSAPSRPSLAVDDAPTDARSLAGDDRPTAAKRPLADLIDDPGSEGTVEVKAESTVLGDKARGQRAAQLVAGAFMVLLALGLGAKFLLARTRTPSTRELTLLYPFGLAGGTLPNGRHAPGVADVEFSLLHADDCGGYRCVTYLAKNADGSFQYQMTLRDDDGLWTYVSSGQAAH